MKNNSQNMENLLFICLDNYPKSGACSAILNNIIYEGHLNNYVNSIHVLSSMHSPEEHDIEIVSNVYIHRIIIPERLSRKELLALHKSKKFNLFGAILKKIKEELSAKISLFYNDCKLTKSILNKAKDIVMKYNITMVIPIAAYFTTISTALRLKKIIPSIEVITYLVDPCSTNLLKPLSSFTLKRRRVLEKKFLAESKVVITTDIIKGDFYQKYGELLLTNTYAFDFPNVIKMNYQKRNFSNSIDFVYSGTIYGGRNPSFCFKLFGMMHLENEVVITFIGTNDVKDHLNNVTIKTMGYVSINESRQFLANADFLVLLGNKTTNQVPSKLFEYISFGKPIINLPQSPNCPTIKYLKKYPLAINIIEGEKPINEQVRELENFINKSYNKTIDWETINAKFYECTPKFFVEKFLQIISNK